METRFIVFEARNDRTGVLTRVAIAENELGDHEPAEFFPFGHSDEPNVLGGEEFTATSTDLMPRAMVLIE